MTNQQLSTSSNMADEEQMVKSVNFDRQKFFSTNEKQINVKNA